MRRRAGLNIYQAYAQQAEPLAVCASRAFWSSVQTHPAALRRDGQLAAAMLKHLSPLLAALPLSSGGKLIGDVPRALGLRVKAAHLLQRHPSLIRFTGWPKPLQPSRFVELPALYDEPHDWISPAALERLRNHDDMQARILLWHFKSAIWLHEQRLMQMTGAAA
jgi:hypothetical protein